MFSWGAEQVQQLRVLAAQGLTASQIAFAIGTGRSAVIGKMRRNDIPLMGASGPRQRPERVAMPTKPAALVSEPVAPEPSEPVSVRDVARGQCHWPVTSDAPWMYCGARTTGTYCAQHLARMYSGSRRD